MIIYTDGSAKGNGKAINTGGWGYVVVSDDDEYITSVFGTENNTTNNRMELMAIISAIEKYGKNSPIPVICSDSSYCINTFTNWIFSWANNGWKNSSKKTPENIDLIMKYYNMINNGYKVDFVKVEGHTGHKWNEYADKLATGRITPEQIEMIEREM